MLRGSTDGVQAPRQPSIKTEDTETISPPEAGFQDQIGPTNKFMVQVSVLKEEMQTFRLTGTNRITQ